MPSQETAIADAVHRTMVGETELLVSLSVAVIGGLIALIYRRSERHSPLYVWFGCALSLMLASCSVVIGFIILGMTIEMAPAFFHVHFEAHKPFSQHDFGKVPFSRLQCFVLLQQILFGLSVICATSTFFVNSVTRKGDTP